MLFEEGGPSGTSLCVHTVRKQMMKRTLRENKRTKTKQTQKMLLSNASCITPGGCSLPQIFTCYEQSLLKNRETFAQSQNVNK